MELERYSAIVRIAEDNANTYALSSQVLAASQEAAAQAIRNAEDALRDGARSYGEYVTASARVRENIEALAGGQAALNDFWRIASGQVEDYSESIETTIPSIVNLTEAENALTAAIEANLQTLQAATGDPLSDYIDTLTLTSGSLRMPRSVPLTGLGKPSGMRIFGVRKRSFVISMMRFVSLKRQSRGSARRWSGSRARCRMRLGVFETQRLS